MKKTGRAAIVFAVLLAGFFLCFDYISAGVHKVRPVNNAVFPQPDDVELSYRQIAKPDGIPLSNEEPRDLYQSEGSDKADPSESLKVWQDAQTIEDSEELDSILLLINKAYQLPADYVPSDLRETMIRFAPGVAPGKKLMREEAARALEDLFKAAEAQNIKLYGVSGYRSFETQRQIYTNKVAAVGQAIADLFVAYPGRSEHQTGLAMDLINQEGTGQQLTKDFAETPEGKWVYDHACEFGFIIRYPPGKEDITGYSYEPWHLRYVGMEAAQIMKDQELTLEEYLAQ